MRIALCATAEVQGDGGAPGPGAPRVASRSWSASRIAQGASRSVQRHDGRRPAGGIGVGAVPRAEPDHQRRALAPDVVAIEIARRASAVVRTVGAEACLVLRAVHAALRRAPLQTPAAVRTLRREGIRAALPPDEDHLV